MFIWYWTSDSLSWGSTQIDVASHAWTDEDFVHLCNIRPSDCCMMVPPEGWECE